MHLHCSFNLWNVLLIARFINTSVQRDFTSLTVLSSNSTHFFPMVHSTVRQMLTTLWFQASVAVQMRSAHFSQYMPHRMVLSYQHFRTTYRSHLQWASSPRRMPPTLRHTVYMHTWSVPGILLGLLDPGRRNWLVVPNISKKLPLYTAIQKSSDFKCQQSYFDMFQSATVVPSYNLWAFHRK
jgi:hypothetical protein